MTKLPIVVQKKNNQNKSVHTSLWHTQIKTQCLSVTSFKNFINEFLFVFCINLSNMWFINWCLDGKITWGFYFKINLLRNGASIKDNGTNSLTMNMTKSFSNWIWWGSFLLQCIILSKKDAMLDGVGLDPKPNSFIPFNPFNPDFLLTCFQMFSECKNFVGRFIVDDATLFKSYMCNINKVTQNTYQLFEFRTTWTYL